MVKEDIMEIINVWTKACLKSRFQSVDKIWKANVKWHRMSKSESK